MDKKQQEKNETKKQKHKDTRKRKENSKETRRKEKKGVYAFYEQQDKKQNCI